MRTVAKPKRSNSGPKKAFTAEDPKNRLAGVSGSGISGTGSIFEEAASARLSSKGVTNEEKYQLIAEAAYFRSEKRSFSPGYELEDWLAAEADIEKML